MLGSLLVKAFINPLSIKDGSWLKEAIAELVMSADDQARCLEAIDSKAARLVSAPLKTGISLLSDAQHAPSSTAKRELVFASRVELTRAEGHADALGLPKVQSLLAITCMMLGEEANSLQWHRRCMKSCISAKASLEDFLKTHNGILSNVLHYKKKVLSSAHDRFKSESLLKVRDGLDTFQLIVMYDHWVSCESTEVLPSRMYAALHQVISIMEARRYAEASDFRVELDRCRNAQDELQYTNWAAMKYAVRRIAIDTLKSDNAARDFVLWMAISDANSPSEEIWKKLGCYPSPNEPGTWIRSGDALLNVPDFIARQ